MLPVWRAIPERLRGAFHAPNGLSSHSRRLGLEIKDGTPGDGQGPVVVCGLADLKAVYNLKRPVVVMDHGVGMHFGENPGYMGGKGIYRKRATLTLAANQVVQANVLKAFPSARVEVVGTPKLDDVTWQKRRIPKKPVIGIGFHWDGSKISPEAGTAWETYRGCLPALAEEFTVLGHGHPRILQQMIPYYHTAGIEVVERWDEVMERADIYVNDCSSTLYEFLVTGKPVVILNAPEFRRDVRHGIRFWEYTDIGPQVNDPWLLLPALRRLVNFPDEYLEGRERAVQDLYPFRGSAADRAARAIMQMGGPCEQPRPITGDCGVVYVAYGEAASAKSIRSLKEVHPELRTAVIRKMDISHSPYEYTLILDADTEVVGSLNGGFDALQAGWDLALALDAGETVKSGQAFGSKEYPCYAPGMVFLRKSPATVEFNKIWLDEQKRRPGCEALVRAVYRSNVRVWVLSRSWVHTKRDEAKHVWQEES